MNSILHTFLKLTDARCIATILFSFCLQALPLNAAGIAPEVQTFLDTYCIRCHGKDLKEGDFRIDNLSSKVGFEDTPQWAEIMERINSGEMPPADGPKLPSADQRAKIVEWIAARIKEGESVRMAKRERVSYRRLTREEYVYTVRDLIGVEYDASDPGGLRFDACELFIQSWQCFLRHAHVVTGMIADLEAIIMKLANLLPTHVVLLVLLEVPAFCDEKRGAESVVLQNWTNDREMRLRRVIKSQHDQAVGNRLLHCTFVRFSRCDRQTQKHKTQRNRKTWFHKQRVLAVRENGSG